MAVAITEYASGLPRPRLRSLGIVCRTVDVIRLTRDCTGGGTTPPATIASTRSRAFMMSSSVGAAGVLSQAESVDTPAGSSRPVILATQSLIPIELVPHVFPPVPYVRDQRRPLGLPPSMSSAPDASR